MRLAIATIALATILGMLPAAQAGTVAEPDVVDPAGDVRWEDPVPAPHPCVDAVDLLSLWVEWTADGALFHFRFNDLSPVEDHPEQDLTGRCFYSYTDFVLTRGDGSELVESLYVDHWANPAFDTGWRFYLHGSGDEAVGTVDIAAGTIDVLVPLAALGNPGPGDALGMFRVQSTTQFLSGPAVADFATDMSPDGEPCECPVPFPGPTDGSGDAEPTQTPEAATTTTSTPRQSASQSASATTTSADAGAVRPPVAGEDAAASGGPSADPATPDKESAAAPWVATLVLLGVLAVRRRLA